MATSGSTDFATQRDDMIKASLRALGATTPGETPSNEQMQTAADELNRMIKHWVTFGDFLFVRQRAVLLPEIDKTVFSIGGTGDHAVAETGYTKTEIKVAAVATDTAIDVDDTTGMTAADYIGIELDDGTMHWSTIASVTDSDTVVIDNAIETGDAAAVDNNVYFYTTKLGRPLAIEDAFIRNDNAHDTELLAISDDAWRRFGQKTSEGVVNQFHYEPTLTNGTLYIYPEHNDPKGIIFFKAHRLFEDMDAAANNFDFPVEWETAIKWNLAQELIPEYAVPIQERSFIKERADETLSQCLGFDRENSSVFFQMES